ncbi:hypothetical protein CDAR_115811 [Caerostris darwini]|uniref:Uncharacterized protein n=1 Tax=Caerostris darwini TaxID=1538125 RepID=A0AAV4PR04_9ARAC|nr:hypothetical protein CDAR_115811 [Caerostris darwini]
MQDRDAKPRKVRKHSLSTPRGKTLPHLSHARKHEQCRSPKIAPSRGEAFFLWARVGSKRTTFCGTPSSHRWPRAKRHEEYERERKDLSEFALCSVCHECSRISRNLSSPSIRSAEEDNEMLEMQQLILFLFFPPHFVSHHVLLEERR